ncbi:hypothetical protein CPB83DRAFT_811692 [Crepidotus variabilis]|uniref:Uncharacterized protein n=1 Tax=Crepidotus variabilis TaxID=179855 RepID=A0A9P6JRP3_9AGAR|nr:hypothetical protein CPB83DRAFT_811692 [Crepidotus variabilis]
MAQQSFPIDEAQLVGLFMQSIFYGTLLWGDGWFKPVRLVHKTMLLATTLMFIIATLDVAFQFRHNLEAFIYFKGDPIDEFNKTSYWLNVVVMGCYVAQVFVGDAVLLYRCWIVYQKNWVVITLPITLWLATTACGITTIYNEATMDTTGKLLNSKIFLPFITSMLCLTLATNVLTTTSRRFPHSIICLDVALIVLRIWGIRQNLTGIYTPHYPLTNLLVVLIESGLMYTLSIVVLFGVYMASNNAQYGVSDAVVQIIGITFNLVITSVHRKESSNRCTIHPIHSHPTQPSGSLPMHNIISIHTTVDRFPDQDLPQKRISSDENQSTPTDTKVTLTKSEGEV